MFGLFRRKRPKPVDPLAAYDGAIEALEREGAAIRQSAATLLVLRAELLRSISKQSAKAAELSRRLEEAKAKDDLLSVRTLGRDLEQLSQRIALNREALAKVEADAATLTDSAEELQRRQGDLVAEREGAHAQLALGQAAITAFVPPSHKVERTVALDAARDEVERAHALAEIYREERLGKLG